MKKRKKETNESSSYHLKPAMVLRNLCSPSRPLLAKKPAMARVKKHNLTTHHLGVCFILLSTVVGLPSTVTASDSALCTIPSPAPKQVPTAGRDALVLLKFFQLSAGGYFVGGEEIHFAKEESDEWSSYVPRSFSLLPHSVQRTEDSDLLHVAATLTLFGRRSISISIGGRAGRRRQTYLGSHTVSFYLDGYYNSTSGELCTTGEGTYSADDGGTLQHLRGVLLKLRVPDRSSLFDPFVNGTLQGAGFKPISLVTYAEGIYQYRREPPSCPSPRLSSSPARGAFHALGSVNFSCAGLKEHLVTSFKLRYGDDALASSSNMSPALPWLQGPLIMHVGQVRCTADGAVRAYVAFSNNTETRGRRAIRSSGFTVKEEALVTEGRWDSARSMLCLTACRVARSEPASLAVLPEQCGIGMSFWFPGVWTIHDRSAVAGMIWNSSHAAGGSGNAAAVGAISASSINIDIHRSNFSDVKYSYNYTMVEKAKDHYLHSELSSSNKKTKGSFVIAANNTYRDFEFHFYDHVMTSHHHGHGQGQAYPVTIDSVIVYGDRLAADDSFSRHAIVNKDNELLNVSYEIRRSVPPAGWEPPKNQSWYSISYEEHQIMAEGVYDPKNGVLCMIGCREFNGSTDCQMLITVQFASLNRRRAQGHGRGAISSLRKKTDHLYFEKIEIRLYGMIDLEVSESISRMDMESAMLAVSTTLPCVFTVIQIFHTRRKPEASAATSITMLVVLALGSAAPLLANSETLFMSRMTQWVPFQSYVPYELNQAMLRAPTLIALLLQLRLLQLVWSGRNSVIVPGQSKAESWSAAERRTLWVCLPLYLAGGALTVIVNLVNGRRAQDSLTVHAGPGPATLWQDLVSSAGLALDGFLLPQVAMNVFSAGGMVRAISPWFYVGSTVVRAMPHVYDVIRRQGYAPSAQSSYVYAGPRDDRFGLAWDIAVPCVAGLLAVLLFLQQRRAGAFLPRSRSRRPGGYEMVSSI